MKYYLQIFLAIIALGLFAEPIFAANTELLSSELTQTEPTGLIPAIKPYNGGVVSQSLLSNKSEKLRSDRIQSIDFTIIDSLQNGYSYYSYRQQPFMYEPTRGLLMTLKRGANTREQDPKNSLDDMFLLISNDLGFTWDPAIRVYSSANQNLGWARYPSLYPFVDTDNNYYVIYTAPITGPDPGGNSGWQGFLNGIYIEGSNEYNLTTGSFTKDTQSGPVTFSWSTDAGLVAGFYDDGVTPYGLAAGHVSPPDPGTPRDQNSNIAYRKPDESFTKWMPVIPDQWASNKYYINYDQDGAGYSSLTGLEYAGGSKMVMSALAVFGDVIENNWPVYAISESEDYGETWSEYDIMPKEMITAFAAANDAVFPDAVMMTFGGYSNSSTGQSYSISRDMCALPNGDVSYLCILQDYLTEEQAAQVTDEQRFRKVVEIYRESGVWGVRAISDIDINTILLYRNTDGEWHNQMVYEFQISRTIDGQYLIAKWTEVTAWDVEGVTDPVLSTDIRFAVRPVGGEWSKVIKLTDDVTLERLTWIPDLIPNDLKDIPIIRVATKPDPSISENDVVGQRGLQNYIETPQYVLLGHFDADIALGINEYNKKNVDVVINEISPNPVISDGQVIFTLPAGGNASLEIFNLMGQKVLSIYNGMISSGIHTLRFSSAELAQGAYYCVLDFNGQRTTKMLSVVR